MLGEKKYKDSNKTFKYICFDDRLWTTYTG